MLQTSPLHALRMAGTNTLSNCPKMHDYNPEGAPHLRQTPQGYHHRGQPNRGWKSRQWAIVLHYWLRGGCLIALFVSRRFQDYTLRVQEIPGLHC